MDSPQAFLEEKEQDEMRLAVSLFFVFIVCCHFQARNIVRNSGPLERILFVALNPLILLSISLTQHNVVWGALTVSIRKQSYILHER